MTKYSTNIIDLKSDIGMTIQEIQAGEDKDIVEELEDIRTALAKMLQGVEF
jgi:hypothetical protein